MISPLIAVRSEPKIGVVSKFSPFLGVGAKQPKLYPAPFADLKFIEVSRQLGIVIYVPEKAQKLPSELAQHYLVEPYNYPGLC